jgi:hypothetical protein
MSRMILAAIFAMILSSSAQAQLSAPVAPEPVSSG